MFGLNRPTQCFLETDKIWFSLSDDVKHAHAPTRQILWICYWLKKTFLLAVVGSLCLIGDVTVKDWNTELVAARLHLSCAFQVSTIILGLKCCWKMTFVELFFLHLLDLILRQKNNYNYDSNNGQFIFTKILNNFQK